jgi:hypothetical protein
MKRVEVDKSFERIESHNYEGRGKARAKRAAVETIEKE